jgi:hypothetical protein
MRLSDPESLVTLLREPLRLPDLDLGVWSELVPWLRRADLLARLEAAYGPSSQCLPGQVLDQLASARRVVDRQNIIVANEINILETILSGHVTKPVLLKGAAYLARGLPNARARFSADVDLMVPRLELESVERRLRDAGWEPVNRSDYDQHYYRDWMHEVPPLRHRERGTFLDLHHAVTPPVSRLAIPSEPLFAAAEPLPDSCLFVLSPPDMVLHSVCHLLSDGEFSHGLRDFFDIDTLIGHFVTQDAKFWDALVARAAELGVGRMLVYAVTFLVENDFGTTVPDDARQTMLAWRPTRPVRELMRWLLRGAILPAVPPTPGDRLADRLMVGRSHYLRMPLTLLVPHLVRKSLLRLRVDPTAST